MSGIGGRRWAKFSKYLLKKEVDIHVLAAKSRGTDISDWYKDITQLESENRITYFESKYPFSLGIVPKTIWQKLKYKFSLLYVKLKVKGNYYDKSAHCQNQLLPLVEKKIIEGYNNVLVSVGPFKYSHFLLPLKKKYPNVRFIIDFRDPWANNLTSFGFDTIGNKRLKYEQKLEKETIIGYDYVVAVAKEINEYYTNQYKQPNNKFSTIFNGYDAVEFNNTKTYYSNSKLTLVFAGTLYNKSIKYVSLLVDFLQKLKSEDEQRYNNLSIQFYGEVPNDFFEITKNEKCIEYFGKKQLAETQAIVSRSDAAMLFLTDDISYSFSTKFLEYIAMKKPIIVFSNGGNTGKFVQENNIGYNITTNNISEVMNEILTQHEQGQLKFNQQFDTSIFNAENLCDEWIKLLQ